MDSMYMYLLYDIMVPSVLPLIGNTGARQHWRNNFDGSSASGLRERIASRKMGKTKQRQSVGYIRIK